MLGKARGCARIASNWPRSAQGSLGKPLKISPNPENSALIAPGFPREANPGLFTQDRCVYHVSDLCWNSNLQAFEENKNSAICCLSGMSGRTLRTSAVATKVVVVIVVDHNGARGGVVVIVIVVVDCAAQHTSSTLKTKRAVDSATEHISQTLQHKKNR